MSAPVVVRGMSDTDYHQDPALSSTGVRKMLDCPARYRHAMDTPPASKDHFEFGHAVHTLTLGTGRPIVNVGPDLRVKASKDKRDQAIADGHTWLRGGDYDTAHRVAEAVRQHPLAAELLSTGEPEVSAWATDESTGVRMRVRPDWLHPKAVVDLKTTARSANPHGFGRTAGDYGYHIQAAYYMNALSLCGLAAEGMPFLFVVVETEPPHLVSVVELDFASLAAGWEACEVGMARFAQCEASGVWPAYSASSVLASVPPWHLRTPNEGDDL